MTMSAMNMIHSLKMSSRPEYYSGRPAMICDFDGHKLFKIYTLIQKNIGEQAADNFVKMIENINDLSASNFLNHLYALEAHNWIYSPSATPKSENSVHTKANSRRLFSSLYGLNCDDTDLIRNTFLDYIRQS